MRKTTAARKEQNLINIRNLIKGSLNVAVCLLNKDFRENLVDYVITTAKSEAHANNDDLKQMQFNPNYVILRRSILNLLDSIELNTCVDEDQLNSEALKGHLRKSIDVALTASGWTREEFDALHNLDYSAMTITSKCAYVLANPKEGSIYCESMEYVNMVLEPIKATYSRLIEGYKEVAEQTVAEIANLPENDKYTLINGTLVAKEHETMFKYLASTEYLKNTLSLSDDNIQKVMSPDGSYNLPTVFFKLYDSMTANELSYDEYNQAIAEAIERDKKLTKLDQDILELEKQNKEGKLSDSDFATQISKLEKEAGL